MRAGGRTRVGRNSGRATKQVPRRHHPPAPPATANLRSTWATTTGRLVLPSWDQVERLAGAFDTFWPVEAHITRLLAYTGLRWQGAAGMAWEHVDMQMRSILLDGIRNVGDAAATPLRAGAGKGDVSGEGAHITILHQAVASLEGLREYASKRDSPW